MNHELNRRWQLQRWISVVRLVAVPWALVEVTVFTADYPSRGYEVAAWATTAVLAVGAVVFFWVARRPVAQSLQPAVYFAGLAFDTLVIWAYAFIYLVRARDADPPAPLLPGRGGGAPLRPRRRPCDAARADPDPLRNRVVA